MSLKFKRTSHHSQQKQVARHPLTLSKQMTQLPKHASHPSPNSCTCVGSKDFGSNGRVYCRHEMASLTCRFSAQRLPLVSHSQICVQSLGGTFHVDTLDVFRVECIHVYFMAQRLTVDEPCYLQTPLFPVTQASHAIPSVKAHCDLAKRK